MPGNQVAYVGWTGSKTEQAGPNNSGSCIVLFVCFN